MASWISWRNFGIFWIGGLLIFGGLVVTGGDLSTSVAPNGILDHQSAGTALRVDEIQASWASAGLMNYAKWSMIGDLIFIGLFSIGGIMGGRLIWQEAHSPSLKKLGLFLVLVYAIFGLTDCAETISQIIQLLNDQGSDILAGIAAIAQPVKVVTWIVGVVGMIVVLIWRRTEHRA